MGPTRSVQMEGEGHPLAGLCEQRARSVSHSEDLEWKFSPASSSHYSSHQCPAGAILLLAGVLEMAAA